MTSSPPSAAVKTMEPPKSPCSIGKNRIVPCNSPFRTPLTNWTRNNKAIVCSGNKENLVNTSSSSLAVDLNSKFDSLDNTVVKCRYGSSSSWWKDIEERDKEREEMLSSIKMLTEKNNRIKDALKREESVKEHQIVIMKKTHATELEIKNALIKNLEDIIDEQESRIFSLIGHMSGFRTLLPEVKTPNGVRRLRESIDDLLTKNTQLAEQLMLEENKRQNLEKHQAQNSIMTNGHSNGKHFFQNGDACRDFEIVEKRLEIIEQERTNLRQAVDVLQNELEKTERAYKSLKLEFQRQDVQYSEKLLLAERKELDLSRQLASEKSKHRLELDLLLNDQRSRIKDNQSIESRKNNEIETLNARLQTERKQREDADKLLLEFKEQISKQNAETKKWRTAVLDLEKQLEEQADRYGRELDDKDKQLLQLSNAYNRVRRDSVDWQQRHDDMAISLDRIRQSLRCLKNEQASLFEYASQINVDTQQTLISARQKISRALTDTLVDLMAKYKHEMRLRKKFYNELVEIKGNIRVFCRVRPIVDCDFDKKNVVEFDHIDERLIYATNDGRRHVFELDNVFRPEKSQDEIFSEIRPLITSCVDGYNVCIFAYGQTGSGKTYTMDGPLSDPGINPRALITLFEEAELRKPEWTFDISVSMLEIHNGSVRDLLSNNAKLDIKMAQDGSVEVPGLLVENVSDVHQVTEVLKIGRKNRVTASTKLNDTSSRSHAVLCVSIKGFNHVTNVKTFGKLNLVDLAGSERVGKSEASGERLKETQAINKSLSALGDVISALKNRRKHIPFRNSKLTYLLQDSLSGDSKMVMVVQVSPSASSVNETICSLTFASRVRSVELGTAATPKSTLNVQNTPNGTATPNTSREYDSCPLSSSTKKQPGRFELRSRFKK